MLKILTHPHFFQFLTESKDAFIYAKMMRNRRKKKNKSILFNIKSIVHVSIEN